ncbi:GTPase domain-containing protein [Luedemannella flava]
MGGSTGAGKSTLVNSLVRAPVSAPGVLRPTTRSPTLVCHPDDAPWFAESHLLPGLARTTQHSDDPATLRVVVAPALRAGLALLDAPDIDSVVADNRALAAQLLAAADLWLFVTTAARYADAVPWDLLRTARDRGAVTALVLDRVPPGADAEIVPDLTRMRAANGVADGPLFVIPESVLDGQGLLAESVVAPVRAWADALAGSAAERADVVRRTVGGAVAALAPIVATVSAAADAQIAAARLLSATVDTAYESGVSAVGNGLSRGDLMRGEVLARWQDLVGTGEFMRGVQARVAALRDRFSAAVTGRPRPADELREALGSGLSVLVREAAAGAAEDAARGWRAHPAGTALLRAAPDLGTPAPDLAARVDMLVREWQQSVLDLVRTEAGQRRHIARVSAYAVNALGLAAMVVVFAATAFIPTGAELAVGAGTTVAAQKILEAIFGDQAVRELAEKARADLLRRVGALLATEADRFRAVLAAAPVDDAAPDALRRAAAEVARAARGANLTPEPAPPGSAAEPHSGARGRVEP